MFRPCLLAGLVLLSACDKTRSDASGAATSTTPSASASASGSASVSGTAPVGTPTSDAGGVDAATGSARATDRFATSAGTLAVTPIHHASLLLELGTTAVYVDPVAEGASFDGLPSADYVLVTDIHSDHLDATGLARVRKAGTVVVGPSAVAAETTVDVVLGNGESHDFGAFTVEAVPMYNLVRGPSSGTYYHDKGRGNGYVVTYGGKRVYLSGDTECTPEMKALANIDVAFVCMNLPYTMPPAEAATCIDAFRPTVVLPYHYRGSNLDDLVLSGGSEVRRRSWY